MGEVCFNKFDEYGHIIVIVFLKTNEHYIYICNTAQHCIALPRLPINLATASKGEGNGWSQVVVRSKFY